MTVVSVKTDSGFDMRTDTIIEYQAKRYIDILLDDHLGHVVAYNALLCGTEGDLVDFIEALHPDNQLKEADIYVLVGAHYVIQIVSKTCPAADFESCPNPERFFAGGLILDVTCTCLDTQLGILKAIMEKCHLVTYTSRKPQEDKIHLSFAFPTQRGINTQHACFSPLPFEEIKDNYAKTIQEKFVKLSKDLEDVDNGLIIVSGPAGTGKTYLLRSLLSELGNTRNGVICSPSEPFLREGGTMSQLVSMFHRPIIVMEDIGDVLTVEAAKTHIDERANILNMSEGLLSEFMDAIIVLTFNNDIEHIDPAILRPGRCIAHLHIGPLTREHASELVGEALPRESYTLAEVYEMKRNGEILV